MTELGQERLAGPISSRIVETRKKAPFVTSDQLSGLVEKTYRQMRIKEQRIHPATRTFQALRIAVNDELNALREGLLQTVSLLASQGRLVVISFHSLEDRIAKELRQESRLDVISDVLRPSEQEVRENPKARSAKLRAYEKK